MAFLALFILSVVVCAASAADEKPCPVVCPLDYRPICGTNGVETKTFANQCNFESENCLRKGNFRKLNDGECPKEEAKN